MSRLNSLMEWIDQTKKFSKAVDYLSLDIIDSIMKVRHVVHRKTLFKHKEFFDFYCNRYHKPSPLESLKLIKTSASLKELMSNYIYENIKRVERLREDIDIQWFEILDFVYERPELVDPSILNDEYVRSHINDVCANKKKKNPFENGMLSRIGKYWKDSKGQWKLERRKRF